MRKLILVCLGVKSSRYMYTGLEELPMGRSKKDIKATFHPDLHKLFNVMEHKNSIYVMTCGSYLHLAIEQLTLTSESFALLM